MKWILGICAVAFVLGVAATMTVPAQTITPDQATLRLLPPDATGVAVIDVGGLRNAALFQEFLPTLEYPGDLREFIEATGFQPDRDVDQVTAAKVGTKDTVAIVRARYDRFKVEQFLQDHQQQVSETYLGRVLYTPNDGGQAAGRISISFIDSLIVAGNTAAVKQVIDRLAAPAQSVLDNQELMVGIRAIESGNQVWAVGQFDLDSIPEAAGVPAPALQFVQGFKGGSYQMRVDSGVHVKAVGNFANDEAARSTGDVLRGLIAVAKLRLNGEQDVLHLLEGVRVDYAGSAMTVRFDGNGELLKKLQTTRRRRATAE